MNTYAVYFRPRGALATWPLASDTLYGAVCWGIRTLGLMEDADLTAWLESQRAKPVFAFSHAFPLYQKAKTQIRMYPRPATFQPSSADFDSLVELYQAKKSVTRKEAQVEAAVAGKKLKKLDYVTEGLLNQIAKGTLKPVEALSAFLFGQGQVTARISTLCLPAEAALLPDVLFEHEAMQHNHIDRMGGATVEGQLFYRDETYFAPGAGLWALLRTSAETFTAYIHPALRYLADTGFGADRTAGKGQFDIQVEQFTQLPQLTAPKAMMTLSHYLPGEGEFDPKSEILAYSLKNLRPKREQKVLRSPDHPNTPRIYKQPMRVFEPGSVFAIQAKKEIYGKIARLTPGTQEAVFQSGAALMIFLA